jgi:hypothetical protein
LDARTLRAYFTFVRGDVDLPRSNPTASMAAAQRHPGAASA